MWPRIMRSQPEDWVPIWSHWSKAWQRCLVKVGYTSLVETRRNSRDSLSWLPDLLPGEGKAIPCRNRESLARSQKRARNLNERYVNCCAVVLFLSRRDSLAVSLFGDVFIDAKNSANLKSVYKVPCRTNTSREKTDRNSISRQFRFSTERSDT